MEEINKPKRSVDEIAFHEFANTLGENLDLLLIKDILSKPNVIDMYGWVDPEMFADWFADAKVGFTGVEEDTPEWTEAFDNNWNWGYDIGDLINKLLDNSIKGNEDAS